MLLNNFSVLNSNPGRSIGGFSNLYSIFKAGTMYNWYVGNHLISNETNKDSFPTGTNPPYSYILGNNGCLLSSTTTITGTCSITSRAISGKSIESTMVGTSSMENNLFLIVAMACNILASSSIDGSLSGKIQLASELAGLGNLEGSLNLISQIVCEINASSSISGDCKGTASMQADLYVNQSQASTIQIVDAVWNALASEFNSAGTMGSKLNSSASAGDPWSTELPGGYEEGSAGNIIGNNLSNSPPTVSEIMAAGDIDGLSLEEALKICLAALAGKLSGIPGSTITIRAADDSKDRIVATVNNGNRTTITLDVTG